MNLITGSTGRIGSHLEIQGARPTKHELDLTDNKAIEKYIKKLKPERIIHLAGLTHGDDIAKLKQVNTEATKVMYETAKEYGLKKFVFASTCSIYDQKEVLPNRETENINPKSLYAKTKYDAEQFLGDDCLVFRIFNVYGKGFSDSLINKLLTGRPIEIYNPDNYYRDYVHSTDVVRILEEGLTNEVYGTFNLCSGVPRNTRALIEYFEDLNIQMSYTIKERKGFSISVGSVEKLEKYFKLPSSDLILQ